jgi:hypothetical protein
MPLHEQLEQEWDDLCDLLDEFGSLRRGQRFSPSIARAFASELIVAKSLDGTTEHMRRDPTAAAHFSVAAHFAVGFVRGGTPVVGAKDATQREPFLLVASAVLNLLDALSDKYPDIPL